MRRANGFARRTSSRSSSSSFASFFLPHSSPLLLYSLLCDSAPLREICSSFSPMTRTSTSMMIRERIERPTQPIESVRLGFIPAMEASLKENLTRSRQDAEIVWTKAAEAPGQREARPGETPGPPGRGSRLPRSFTPLWSPLTPSRGDRREGPGRVTPGARMGVPGGARAIAFSTLRPLEVFPPSAPSRESAVQFAESGICDRPAGCALRAYPRRLSTNNPRPGDARPSGPARRSIKGML